MAYFIDKTGTLLFDISIEITKNDKPIKTIVGKRGDLIKEVLIMLYEADNLYSHDAKYSLTWNWKAENQDYNTLIEFLRGPIDTITV